MHFNVIGINHHITPIEIREKVHFSETQIIEASELLQKDNIIEFAILSTCNRSEVYILTKGSTFTKEDGLNFYRDFFQVENLSDYMFYKKDHEAIKHLFRVSCGMDSLVVGEDQILGQVKEAHQTAMEIGTSKKILNKIFREAVTLAKKIKTETHISDQPLSIAYIGVKKIAQEIPLSTSTALIIGMGNMGRLAMTHLLEEGAKIIISNRTLANSQAVKQDHPEVEIVDYQNLSQAIQKAQVIISATSSPHTILIKDDFKDSLEHKYVMDLSLPRDVHENVAQVKNVSLFDIDHLQTISHENLQIKKNILSNYEPQVDDLTRDLLVWIRHAKVDPIMKGLNERCDEIAQETLDYIFRKTDLNHSQKMKVDKIVRNALKKVAREPVLYVKEGNISETDRDIALNVLKEVYDL